MADLDAILVELDALAETSGGGTAYDLIEEYADTPDDRATDETLIKVTEIMERHGRSTTDDGLDDFLNELGVVYHDEEPIEDED